MSGKEKYLIDTNILIYFIDGKFTQSQKEEVTSIFTKSFNISIISKIEFLGFEEYLDKSKFEIAKNFISHANVFHLDDDMADTIIEIRQQKKIKLGDAIIAATAILHDFTIVTRNQKDFENINGISVFNPFAQ